MASAMAVLSCLHAMASVLEIFLICRPFAAQWDPRILGLCGDQVVSFVTLEVIGLLLDLGILLLPVHTIFYLNARQSQKWKAIFILDISAG